MATRHSRRIRLGIGAMALLLVGLIAVPAVAAANPPNLSLCAHPKPPLNDALERKRPLPVPAALAGIMNSDLLHYAVRTLAGGVVCVDTSWMEAATRHALLGSGRFLSFDWIGNEASGHIIVDRSGRGQVVDTGVAPNFSPSHARMAAAEATESGFGSLNAFAVWRVDPVGLREIGRVEDLPRGLTDWRVEGWRGENCVALSALPMVLGVASQRPRRHFAARSNGGRWVITAGACPSA